MSLNQSFISDFSEVGLGLILCIWPGQTGFNCCISFAPLFQCRSCCRVLDPDLHVRSPRRGPNSLYLYEPQQRLERGLRASKAVLLFNPQSNLLPKGDASTVVHSNCYCPIRLTRKLKQNTSKPQTALFIYK